MIKSMAIFVAADTEQLSVFGSGQAFGSKVASTVKPSQLKCSTPLSVLVVVTDD